jgi:tetratricopeptide (TPR) repeat protein
VFQRVRQTRYRIDEETLAAAQAAARAAQKGVDDYDLVNALGTLGEISFWYGNTEESQNAWQTALTVAEDAYDQAGQLWCMAGLCLIGVRRHDLETVRRLSLQAGEGAMNPGTAVFSGVAEGAMAWVAWKDERVEDLVAHANKALALWRSSWRIYFFKGLCLWPLMSVQLASGDIASAVAAGCEMLEPSQVRLPDELEALIEGAKAAWDRHEPAATAVQLNYALQLACQLGYA